MKFRFPMSAAAIASALIIFASEASCDAKIVAADVSISFPSEFVSYKLSLTGAKLSMQSWLI